MEYTVSQVAALAHVTVRTLHHYDEIGLVRPSGRTAAGYRLYGERDLARLQHVLGYRALGFPLARVKEILDDPDWDEVSGLREQRALLAEREEHLQHLIAAVDKALEAHVMEIKLTPEERFEVFGDFDPEEYAEEAAERWGETDAYKESARRARKYSKEDWQAIKAEGHEAFRGLAELLVAGVPADDERAAEAIDKHRAQIDRWFYPCSQEMYVGVLEMQVGDARFRATWDGYAEGLLDYALAAARTGLAS
jgi:DNA-binding transcriptional MerR regulator